MLVVPPFRSESLLSPTFTLTLAIGGGALVLAVLAWTRATDKAGQSAVAKPRTIHTLDTTLPLLGNLLDRVRHGDVMYDWMLQYCLAFRGEPWKFKVPGQPDIIMLSTPEAVEEVTTTQLDAFPKGEFLLGLIRDMFGEGMIASDGARWYHQRKAAIRFFSAKTLRTLMRESMRTNLRRVCDVLDGAQPGHPVDLGQLFLEFTIETFAEMGLGVKLDCIGAREPHPFQHALDTVSPITALRFRVPGWYWRLQRWLNLGAERVLAEQMQVVHSWLRETIQSSLDASVRKHDITKATEASDNANMDNDASHIKSIVELFIEQSKEHTEGLQADDLVDFLLTFVIASRDTTATTLSCFFLLLSRHPHVTAKIHEEMRAQLHAAELAGGYTDGQIPYLTSEHTRSLTYLEATIKEVVRLYPAAPFTVREAAKDTVICGDIVVRKGQIMGLCAYAMARNPLVWGADAAEFKPERWIDPETGSLIQVPASKFFSFSAGPRTCIGMGLAMLELRVVTANLLYRYDVDIDPSNDFSYIVAPTFALKHPLLATVRPRESVS